MKDSIDKRYEDVVACWVPDEGGSVHVKVIALPHNDPVELTAEEARDFARRLLELAAKAE